jgi:hypothetical protein
MRAVIPALLSLCLTAFAALSNPPTLVNLRIEGADHTIYEGPILTRGHNVTSPSGGTHHCDGTNNNVNPTPGPTCTTALNDAAKLSSFDWDGFVAMNIFTNLRILN